MRRLILLAVCCCLIQFSRIENAVADTTYQTPDALLRETFGPTVPAPAFIWLNTTLQARINPVLGHNYPQARVRYWRSGARTVWILEEIGKEFPITASFTLDTTKPSISSRIIDTRVLIYRESRGDEIHLANFLKQFSGGHLDQNQFSAKIDSITGATLSVQAMQKMATVALILNDAAHD